MKSREVRKEKAIALSAANDFDFLNNVIFPVGNQLQLDVSNISTIKASARQLTSLSNSVMMSFSTRKLGKSI